MMLGAKTPSARTRRIKLFVNVATMFVAIFLGIGLTYAYFTARATSQGEILFANISADFVDATDQVYTQELLTQQLGKIKPGDNIQLEQIYVKNIGEYDIYALIEVTFEAFKYGETTASYTTSSWYNLSGTKITGDVATTTVEATMLAVNTKAEAVITFSVPGSLDNAYKNGSANIKAKAHVIQSLLEQESGVSTAVTASRLIYQYKDQQDVEHTVYIRPNGGSYNSSTDNVTISQERGTTLTLGTPTRTGYTFTGWTFSGDGSLTDSIYTFGKSVGVITANWQANNYKVSFDANNGILEDNIRVVNYDSTYGNNVNIYNSASSNFSNLYGSVADNIITIICDNAAGTSERWCNFFTKTTSLVEPNKTYTYVIEILEWNGGSPLRLYLGKTPGSGTELTQLSYSSFNVDGTGIYFKTITATEYDNPTYMGRDFFAIPAGKKLDCKMRVSLYAGDSVTNQGNNFKYVPFGETQSCELPTPTREGYAFGGWTPVLYTNDEEKTNNGSINSEFVQYDDLAPYINKYGLVEYTLELDLKSADTSSYNFIRVYFQNGSDSKYNGLYALVNVTTEYQHYTITFTPQVQNASLQKSILAFYGTYGTGNSPIVKNVKLVVNTPVITNSTTVQIATDHELYAQWIPTSEATIYNNGEPVVLSQTLNLDGKQLDVKNYVVKIFVSGTLTKSKDDYKNQLAVITKLM